MTIPTTPTGGEPTAGPWEIDVPGGHDPITIRTPPDGDVNGDTGEHIMVGWEVIATIADGPCEEANAHLIASAPTLATRVAELEGMLAVAREALEPFATVFNDWIGSGQPVGIISMVTDASAHGRLGSKHFRHAAQAIAQLDKEAGGK